MARAPRRARAIVVRRMPGAGRTWLVAPTRRSRTSAETRAPSGRFRPPGAASGPGRPRPRSGRAPVRRPRACRGAWRCRTPGRSRRAGSGRGGAQPVLGDEDVAVDAGDGVEDAEVGGAAVALALGVRGRLRGDLEAQQLPAASAEASLRRCRPGPAGRTPERQVPGRGGLPDPVQADARAEHPGDGPLDVRAERARRGCTYRTPRVVTGTSGLSGTSRNGRNGRDRAGRVDGEATVRPGKECDVPSVPVPTNLCHSPGRTLVRV